MQISLNFYTKIVKFFHQDGQPFLQKSSTLFTKIVTFSHNQNQSPKKSIIIDNKNSLLIIGTVRNSLSIIIETFDIPNDYDILFCDKEMAGMDLNNIRQMLTQFLENYTHWGQVCLLGSQSLRHRFYK